MKFECLALSTPLLRGLHTAGYCEATPIQQKAIPQLLKGRDVVGCAQTGTGKTAAFVLPTLQQLMTSAAKPTGAARRRHRSGRRDIRGLILAPTRELASQIGDSLETYGKFTHLRHAVLFGGVRQGPQVRAIQAGIDILVATPGRLLDLITQGFVKLGAVEILILDEADQMLDMGFIRDLRKIVAHVPERRQTLLFSATMPKEIRALAEEWLRRPYEVDVAPAATTSDRISQVVFFVERHLKAAALRQFLLENQRTKTLVFSRTKRGADRIARRLERDGIPAVAIHGDKSQAKRQSVMRAFNSNRPPVLVATDLAARGLDFSDVAHVINYDLPDAPETYVHRIGRTARAGASGQAISFCSRDERQLLHTIEGLMGQSVPVKESSAVAHNAPSRADTIVGRQSEVGRAAAATAETGHQESAGNRMQRPKRRTQRTGRQAQGRSSESSTQSKRHKSATQPRRRKKRRSRATSER